MKKILLLIAILPFLLGAGEVKTVAGKADSALATVMGKTSASIKTMAGKDYNDGDAGFLFSETFNGSTEDNTWTWPDTEWGDDNTTSPINGAQDVLKASGAGSNGTGTAALSSAQDNLYAMAKFRLGTVSGSGNQTGLEVQDASGNCLCRAVTANDTSERSYRVYAYYGSACGSSAYTSYAGSELDCTGTCVIKLEYNKGTGSNAVCNVRHTTLTDYTSNGWTNAKVKTVTNGNMTAQAGKIGLFDSSATDVTQFDDVIAHGTDTVAY